MLLTTALMTSMHHIATRRRPVGAIGKRKKVVYEYLIAVASQRGVIHIFNGRNGTIRRVSQEDQMVNDWTPFQHFPDMRSKHQMKKAIEASLSGMAKSEGGDE